MSHRHWRYPCSVFEPNANLKCSWAVEHCHFHIMPLQLMSITDKILGKIFVALHLFTAKISLTDCVQSHWRLYYKETLSMFCFHHNCWRSPIAETEVSTCCIFAIRGTIVDLKVEQLTHREMLISSFMSCWLMRISRWRSEWGTIPGSLSCVSFLSSSSSSSPNWFTQSSTLAIMSFTVSFTAFSVWIVENLVYICRDVVHDLMRKSYCGEAFGCDICSSFTHFLSQLLQSLSFLFQIFLDPRSSFHSHTLQERNDSFPYQPPSEVFEMWPLLL